jgi:hypothetical protein
MILAKPRTVESAEDFNSYGSSIDGNGVYTVIDFKRQNTTLWMRSTASNVDANGNYQTLTLAFYDAPGTSIIRTDIWTVTYDANNHIVTEVKT